MDISYDSKLVVTCSADKNVKIWGLDFGDCHRSIFAHDESIMQVAFEKESHHFWTVSKDKMVKYWDGDRVGDVFLICFRIRSTPPGFVFVDLLAALVPCFFFSFSSREFRPWKGTTGKFGLSSLVAVETSSSRDPTTNLSESGRSSTILCSWKRSANVIWRGCTMRISPKP